MIEDGGYADEYDIDAIAALLSLQG